jgi:methyl-accepting chemotaxis protein
MDNHLMTVFIAVTSAAVLIQAGILVALYLAVRKTSARVEELASEVKTKALPAVESAQLMLTQLRPRVEVITENLAESSTLVRNQIQRVDATVTEIVDRTRLQVIRADELLNRTMNRVEETTSTVHRTVVSPIRHLSGLMQGLAAGMEAFFGQRRGRSREGVGVPQDELFI